MADEGGGSDGPPGNEEKKSLRAATVKLMQRMQKQSEKAAGTKACSQPDCDEESYCSSSCSSASNSGRDNTDNDEGSNAARRFEEISFDTDVEREHIQQGRLRSNSNSAMLPSDNAGLPPPTYEEAIASMINNSSGSPASSVRNRFRSTRAETPQDELEMIEVSVIPDTPFLDGENRDRSEEGGKPDKGRSALYKVNGDERRSSLLFADGEDSEPAAAAMGNGSDLDITMHAAAREALDGGTADVVSVEEGRGRQDTEEDTSITGRLFKFIGRQRENVTTTRFLIIFIVVMVILGALLFVSLFPPSFVYLDYDKIALSYNTITGTVDRSTTYYPGCYLLGPSTRFLEFTGTAHDISHNFDVFTVDRLPIFVAYYLQYYIRPEELGTLHKMFGKNYDSVLQNIMKSEIKNTVTSFSVDDFRLKRKTMEFFFHTTLQNRLGGTCCQSCCPSNCQNNTMCTTCLPAGSCNQAYHVDIRYFQLAGIGIPSDISDLYLKRALLQVYAEKEYFVQESMVTQKETERITKHLRNEAAEKLASGTADANLITKTSYAEREVDLTSAYIHGLSYVYKTLNITKEEHKLSVMMIRAYEDQAVKGNLYRSYGFLNDTIYTSHDST